MVKNFNKKPTSDNLTPLEKVRGRLPLLKAGDIILIHTKKSLLRMLIRAVTKSYWDHVTMIVFPKGEHTLKHNIVIENTKPPHSLVFFLLDYFLEGTEVHRLNKYLNDPHKYDVGIKRTSGLSEEHRHRISTYTIATIDTPYWRLSFWSFFLAWVWPQYRKWFLRRQRWSCSALIQRAYYESVDNWNDRLKLVFKEGDLSPIEIQDLVSPAEIAVSPNAEWIYNKR